MIELKHLWVGYGGAPILEDVSLTFPRGKVTVLLGCNGCGKSTLLKSIVGLAKRCSGQILIGGTPVERFDSAALARQVSYLPQTRRVPDMTVERLVLHGRFPYLRYPRRYQDVDFEIARQAMDRAGVAQFAQSPLSRLSGGTRQKAYIAMALAQDTGTILLDEPNTHLDIAHQLQFMEQCRMLAREGKAVVLVLHDLNLALGYADSIALLSGGGVTAWGTPETVYDSGALERVFGVEIRRIQTPFGQQYCCRIPKNEEESPWHTFPCSST